MVLAVRHDLLYKQVVGYNFQEYEIMHKIDRFYLISFGNNSIKIAVCVSVYLSFFNLYKRVDETSARPSSRLYTAVIENFERGRGGVK